VRVRCRERGNHTSHQPGFSRDGAESAAIGVPVLVSVSAPTALAVRMADAAGITLAAIARADGFEVFTHPYRISSGPLPMSLIGEGSTHGTQF